MTSPRGAAGSADSAGSADPVEAAWERIETWLAAHAPVTFDALAPPADPAAIAAAEQAIDPSFPEPLRRSLLRHDGTTGHRTLVLPNYRLLSAAEIADRWLTGIEDESPAPWWDENGAGDTENPDSGLGWHRQWIPFAADCRGDCLVIDERPTSRRRGRIGDADHESGCFFRPETMWASLPALLDATATALETGEQLDRHKPLVTPEGELDWEIL